MQAGAWLILQGSRARPASRGSREHTRHPAATHHPVQRSRALVPQSPQPATHLRPPLLQAQPLILAAHTKSKLEELLMGSTSKFCVSHCKQPVLLLH